MAQPIGTVGLQKIVLRGCEIARKGIPVVFVVVVEDMEKIEKRDGMGEGFPDTRREKEGDARRFRRPPPTVEHRDRLDQCGAIGERLGIAQFLRLGKATSKA